MSRIRVRGGVRKQDAAALVRKLAYRFQTWEVWSDFCLMAACAISSPVDAEHHDKREALYAQTAKKYNAKELELFAELFATVVMALDEDPDQDFLGDLFMQLELGSHWHGQFFTPYSICRCMAEISIADMYGILAEKGWCSVNDPACGAGALLIAFANECRRRPGREVNYQTSVLFVAQDIDYTAAMMCYIQLSLLGCPGYVIVGNTLTTPPTESLQNQDVWYTPMYYRDIWHWRRLWNQLSRIMPTIPPQAPPDSPEEQPEVPVEQGQETTPTTAVSYGENQVGQLMFF